MFKSNYALNEEYNAIRADENVMNVSRSYRKLLTESKRSTTNGRNMWPLIMLSGESRYSLDQYRLIKNLLPKK